MDRERNQAVWRTRTRPGTELGKRDIRNKYREISGRDIGKARKATQRKAPRKVSGKLPGHYRKTAAYFSV